MSHHGLIEATRQRAQREGVLTSAVGIETRREGPVDDSPFGGETWSFTDINGTTHRGMTLRKAVACWVIEVGIAAARLSHNE